MSLYSTAPFAWKVWATPSWDASFFLGTIEGIGLHTVKFRARNSLGTEIGIYSNRSTAKNALVRDAKKRGVIS